MPLSPAALMRFMAEARTIARDGILNDPTGDEIMLAVADMADPKTEIDLLKDISPWEREQIISEYDRWEAR